MSRPLRAAGVVAALVASACGPDWDALDPSLAGGCAGLDDGDPCTDDTCAEGAPFHRPAPTGTPCGAGLSCDGSGTCVGCADASECPGVDDDCRTRACADAACTSLFAPEGTLAGPQVEGDCQAIVCDGAGAHVSVSADEDRPPDPGGCVAGACAAGAPTVAPSPAGSACGAADASYCDGAGTCVTCEPVTAATWNSADTPIAVPGGATASSTIGVLGMPRSIVDVDVKVTLTGDATAGELTMVLVSPGGTAIELTSGNGGASTGVFAGTTFDDDAAAPAARVTEAAFSDGVLLAAAIPERNLGVLNGEAPDGAWTLEVSDANAAAGDATLLAWSLTIASQPGNVLLAERSFASDSAATIPDGNAAGVSSVIDVAGVFGSVYRAKVKVTLEHMDSGDLSFSLVSPAGTSVTLSRENGGTYKDVFAGTTFDDAASLLVGCQGAGCVTYGNNQVVPAAIPEGSLSALVGEAPAGAWTLEVSDQKSGTQGSLQAWSLEITPALCPLE